MNKMRFLNYLWKSRSARWQIILTGILIAVFVSLLVNSRLQSMGFAEMWQNWMEAFLAFGTIIIAIFIWYNEKKQNWENNLPKKLNVCFRHNEQDFYQVINAPLAGSEDVRQWGQQLGRQMHGGDLSFKEFSVKEPMRPTDENGKYVMRYELTVWLQNFDESKGKKTWEYGDDGKFINDEKRENINNHPT